MAGPKSKPTFPENKSPPQRRQNHQQEAKFREPVQPSRLFLLCLLGLLAGLNDITHLSLAKAQSPVNSLLLHACTAIPFALGAVLAAAFLEPLVPSSHHHLLPHPYSLLAAVSLLIACSHASVVVASAFRPLLLRSPQLQGPLTAVAHLCLGIGSTSILSLATTALAAARSGETVGGLGALYGAVALGVALRMAVTSVPGAYGGGGGGGDGGFAIVVVEGKEQQRHLLVLGLGLVTAAVCLVLASSSSSSSADPLGYQKGAAEVGISATPIEVPAPFRQGNMHPRMPGALDDTGRSGYPPPASRTTVFGALFALTYHAAVVAIPPVFASLTARGQENDSTGQQSAAPRVLVAFWMASAMGRFMLGTCSRHIQPQRGIPLAVMAAAGIVVASKLSPVVGLGRDSPTVAAGLVGFALGPVYPWAKSVLLDEMDEEETPGGMGIVVAFACSGATVSLSATTFAAQLEQGSPVFSLIIAGLLASMLVSWRALACPEERGTGFHSRA